MTPSTPDVLHLLRPAPAAGFDTRPVPVQTVEALLDIAARAPSGTNTQPWNVVAVAGAARERLVQLAALQVPGLVSEPALREAFWREWEAHPTARGWKAEAVEVAARAADADLAQALQLAEARPEESRQALQRYFGFHGAPVALFVLLHQQLGAGSVLDTGMFLQNIVLAARSRGLRAVLQSGWRGLGAPLHAGLAAAPEQFVLCAVALGWSTAAPDAAAQPQPAPDVAGAIRWYT